MNHVVTTAGGRNDTLLRKAQLLTPLTAVFCWLLIINHWLLARVLGHFLLLCLWPLGLLVGVQVVIWCLEEPWQDFKLRRAQVRRHVMFAIKPIHHYSSKATYVGTQPTTPKEGMQ